MIAYLEGTILHQASGTIILKAGAVGYEVLIPAFLQTHTSVLAIGEPLALFIYFHQSTHTPKPVLIGFRLLAEREFFERFLSVDGIGPIKAAKSLTLPIAQIATAIEAGDIRTLSELKGVGKRSAEQIAASLKGKMAKFALIRKQDPSENEGELEIFAPLDAQAQRFSQNVTDVLVNQLGYKKAEAKTMVDLAAAKIAPVQSAEQLFDEIFRQNKSR